MYDVPCTLKVSIHADNVHAIVEAIVIRYQGGMKQVHALPDQHPLQNEAQAKHESDDRWVPGFHNFS